MNFLEPYLGFLKAAAVIAAVIALFGAGHHFGAQGVRADWAKETAERKTAENRAVFERLRNNERQIEQDRINSQRIAKEKKDAIDKVRADIARAPGLRVGPGICSGFASAAQAGGAGSGDGADSRTRLVPEEIRRDIDALKLEVELAFAAGRAAQEFIRSNGMAP